ncbi:MAG: GNAT family N-acetyltransferase [Solirubrobacteraceae bacterium]
MTNSPPLRARRVELAPLRNEDSPFFFDWINDRELVTLSAPFQPVSREAHDAWFAGVRHRDDMRIFGIRLLDGDQLVGSCQLHNIHPVHRNAELQIRVGAEAARGLGVGTEATHLLLRFGFEELGLHRIYLHVFQTNERALRLYRRVGFREEGLLREAAFVREAWIDVVIMAILNSDPGSTV